MGWQELNVVIMDNYHYSRNPHMQQRHLVNVIAIAEMHTHTHTHTQLFSYMYLYKIT